MRLEYDPASNAAYIRFSADDIEESEEVSEGIILDYDSAGRIVGMEILDARRHLPPAFLAEAA